MAQFKYTVIKTSSAEAFENDLNQSGAKELIATHISSSNHEGKELITYVAVLRENVSTPGRSHE